MCYQRIGDRRLEGYVELIGGDIEFLKNTKFFLPQSEIMERSEVKRSAAFNLELFNPCWLGRLLKKRSNEEWSHQHENG